MKHPASGFTLIELLVTLAVAAILLAIGVPGLRNILLTNRLATTANEVVAALNLARSEAIKRNARVDFNADGSVSVPTAAGSTPLAAAVAVPPGIGLASVHALQATPTGFLQSAGAAGGYTGLVADVSAADLPGYNRRCVYLATGVAAPTCAASGACPNAQPNPCKQ